MFEQIRHEPRARAPLNPLALAAATLAMVVGTGALAWACLWFLSQLGFTNRDPVVEVTYDPYDDGSTLEQLLQEEQRVPSAPEPAEDR
ncbi:MAG: hypothetical protein H6739_26790 [Alphaproteobacteria bacterium]|nr:hypothetical protein [Alphaproteobacteria bacterium]